MMQLSQHHRTTHTPKPLPTKPVRAAATENRNILQYQANFTFPHLTSHQPRDAGAHSSILDLHQQISLSLRFHAFNQQAEAKLSWLTAEFLLLHKSKKNNILNYNNIIFLTLAYLMISPVSLDSFGNLFHCEAFV